MVDPHEKMENERQVSFSLNLLAKYGIAKKYYYEKSNDYRFVLTKRAANRLFAPAKSNKGNKNMACLELLFETIAKGKKNAQTLEALSFHSSVLHFLAFKEKPSKEDYENTISPDNKCDGFCELCPDEYCPAKDIKTFERH
jgi:hypothetical protein